MRKTLIPTIIKTVQNFEKHNGASYAAAIAYHAIISLGPSLLVAVSIVSRTFDESAVKNQIIASIAALAGQDIASLLTQLIDDLTRPSSEGTLAAVITACVVLYASTNVSRQIVIALNAIWEQERPKRESTLVPLNFVKRYGFAFAASVATVLVLFLAMLSSTIIGLLLPSVASQAPALVSLLPWLTAVVLPVLLFMICWGAFTWLPNAQLSLKETRTGALLTGVVLAAGGGMVGYFASHSPVPDLLGVASALIILLLWMFFVALIFLLGAEFTRTSITLRKG